MPKPSDSPDQVTFSFIPQMVPQGDGTFVVKPGRPTQKLTVRQAAQVANCSVATIYRLLDAGLIQGDRPSPRKVAIYASSLEEHLAKTRDPEFWNTDRRRTFRASI